MTNIRMICQGCGVPALIRPDQILLLADADSTAGLYMFLCPVCERLTVRSAKAAEVQLLVGAGVPTDGGDGRTTGEQPPARTEAWPPFTFDDLLDFHLLLVDADHWFARLDGSVRPPLPG